MPRHPAVTQLRRWFRFDHLPSGKPKQASLQCANLLDNILLLIPDDSPELIAGIRKLLEAKDCFVRAAIDATTTDREN